MTNTNSLITKDRMKHLVESYGVLGSIKCLKEKYGNDMNTHIVDQYLRIIVWQITHSLEVLESIVGTEILLVEQLEAILSSDSIVMESTLIDERKVISNHLINGIESFENYMTFNTEEK